GTQMGPRGRWRRSTRLGWSKGRIVRWVISKSVMAPLRSGRTATMYPGVRPISCHASRPMASTSWVCEFKAITVGSLSTMPRPRVYTRVLAVPRSMARSLASPALPPGPVDGPAPGAVGRQRPQLAGKLLDARLHARRLACPQHQHHRAHQAQARSHEPVPEVAHD